MPHAPFVGRPGDGPTYHLLGGDVVTVRATGAETGDGFTLFETTVPVGGGPPPHVHRREDESFYVLDGELEFEIGGLKHRVGPGSFCYGPRDVPHSFRNVGTAPARMLIVIQPAGFEKFAEELAQLTPDQPPDFQRLQALAAKYGLEFVEA